LGVLGFHIPALVSRFALFETSQELQQPAYRQAGDEIRASLLSFCKKITAKNNKFVEMLTHFEFVGSKSIFAKKRRQKAEGSGQQSVGRCNNLKLET
jgi:hypothetical protein